MSTLISRLVAAMIAVLLAVTITTPAAAARNKDFSLTRSVPRDVYLFTSARSNPDRAFLDAHWSRVRDKLASSGVIDDAFSLLATAVGPEHAATLDTLRARASELADGVDWHALASQEMAFAERMPGATPIRGPAEMVWLLRGDPSTAAANVDGLVAILEAVTDSANSMIGQTALELERSERHGFQIATLKLSEPGSDTMPPLEIAIARSNELIVIGVRPDLFEDTLALTSGKAKRSTSLAKSERFTSAFKDLPEAEDQLLYFDIPALMAPVRMTISKALSQLTPRDVVLSSSTQGPVHDLTTEAWAAYANGEIQRGHELVREAYEQAPHDSRVLYYLACFESLAGERETALAHLKEAVEGGFFSPGHISRDPDLEALRDDPRYGEALEHAREMAATLARARDVVEGSTSDGKVADLNRQAWAAYEQSDYPSGRDLVAQALEVAPDDPHSLYAMACFQALTGDRESALDYLERAVENGFWRPHHISSDPDLTSLRDDDRYKRALEQAIAHAAEHGIDWIGVARGASDIVMGVPEIFDRVASVTMTDGVSVHTHTVTYLVSGAAGHPFFPVLASATSSQPFDRYLPQETRSFAVSSQVDLNTLYGFITRSLASVPDGKKILDRWGTLQKRWGFDIEKDLLSWLGNDCLRVVLEDKAWVFMVETTDDEVARARVGAGLDLLVARLDGLASKNPMVAMVRPQRTAVTDGSLAGFEKITIAAAAGKSVLWGVKDGRLMVGSSAEALNLCLDTASGNHPGARANAELMARALTPPATFSRVSLEDQQALGQKMSQLVGMVGLGINMAAMQVEDQQGRELFKGLGTIAGKLAPVLTEIDFFDSTATVTSFDGTAFTGHKVVHYRGSE